MTGQSRIVEIVCDEGTKCRCRQHSDCEKTKAWVNGDEVIFLDAKGWAHVEGRDLCPKHNA